MGLVAVVARRGVAGGGVPVSLAAIVVIDISRVTHGSYHVAPAAAVMVSPGVVEAVRRREGPLGPGRFRLASILKAVPGASEQLKQSLGPEAARAVVYRQALGFNHNALFDIESPHFALPGFTPALPAMLVPGRTVLRADIAARYNVTYYVGAFTEFMRYPTLRSALIDVQSEYGVVLARNPVPAKPRAYLSQRPERAMATLDAATLRERPDFLSGVLDVIETPEPNLPAGARAGAVEIERYQPEEVRVRVGTEAPAVLVLLDAFEAGWTARLDDAGDIPIRRANLLVRAVVVPAGVHTVTFSYRTPLLGVGAAGSAAGLVLSLGLVVSARRRARRSRSRPVA
jgi:hypothetical protein